METSISNFAANFPASGIRHMFVLAAQYDNVCNLCNGEPNFDTPQNIIDAACASLQNKETRYGAEAGIPELRQAIADKYTKQFGFEFYPEDTMVTAGGVETIILSLMTFINPGDEVIIPNPSYTCYEGQVRLLGAKVVRVPLKEEHNFRLQPEDLEAVITPKTKAIIMNYPTNPVGAVLDPESAAKLAEVVMKHNLIVLSDEVYEKLVFDGRTHYSIAQVPGMAEHTLVCNSFSKTYAMTGWRLGYVVSKNKAIMSVISKMQQSLISCVPVFVMRAGVEALTGPQDAVEAMMKEYEERRNIMYDELSKVPKFKVFKPEGSFCTYINVKEWGIPSQQLAEEILREARVLTVSGSAFGSEGEGYLRVCFANSIPNIIEGTKRIREYMESRA